MYKKSRNYYETIFRVIWDNSIWFVSKDYEEALLEAIKLKKRFQQDDIKLRTSVKEEIDEYITI